jgi:hypothetical protein
MVLDAAPDSNLPNLHSACGIAAYDRNDLLIQTKRIEGKCM